MVRFLSGMCLVIGFAAPTQALACGMYRVERVAASEDERPSLLTALAEIEDAKAPSEVPKLEKAPATAVKSVNDETSKKEAQPKSSTPQS